MNQKIHFTNSCTLYKIHNTESGMIDIVSFSSDYFSFPCRCHPNNSAHPYTHLWL